ncbi:hypothetical protein [Neisseria gonorrhoeae]|uniref:hypothetical protein n=1 Tax=Neisseria gonorrhoeae TaxID=485 RepID=UPI003F752E2D
MLPNTGAAQCLLDAEDAVGRIGMVCPGVVPGAGGVENPGGLGVFAQKKAQQGVEFQEQAGQRHGFGKGGADGIRLGMGGKPDILFTVLCYYIPRSIFNHI